MRFLVQIIVSVHKGSQERRTIGNHECVHPIKHGGDSVLVWGCILISGVGGFCQN